MKVILVIIADSDEKNMKFYKDINKKPPTCICIHNIYMCMWKRLGPIRNDNSDAFINTEALGNAHRNSMRRLAQGRLGDTQRQLLQFRHRGELHALYGCEAQVQTSPQVMGVEWDLHAVNTFWLSLYHLSPSENET